MPIPKSFEAFRQLFEGQLSEEVGDPALPEPEDVDRDEDKPEQTEEDEKVENILSIACDAILADLHDNEMLRDAVISSIPNNSNKSILLVISPTLQATGDLVEFLNEHPRVHKFALGSHAFEDGERIKAIKIAPVPVKDECDSPDPRDQKNKEQEQDNLQNISGEEDRGGLGTAFSGQGPTL